MCSSVSEPAYRWVIVVASAIMLAVGMGVMGRLADRSTTWRVSIIGAITLGLCLLLAARADALW